MLLPFPHGQAEICARDLAADCRNLSKRAIILKDAIERKEANAREQAEYELLVKQIKSLCNLVCMDEVTEEQFRVGDFVTIKREMMANIRAASLKNAYEKLRKWLH